MIRLERLASAKDDDTVGLYLNPSHIVSVTHDAYVTYVRTSDGSSWRVEESVEDVVALIQEARDKE